MKISKRDTKLLLILAGLLVFLAAYMGLFNPYQAKADAVAAESVQLEARVAELESLYLHLGTYEQGIEEYRDTVARQLEKYPANIENEDFLSYLLTMEKRQGITIESVSFDAPALISEFSAVVEQDGEDVPVTMSAYRTGAVMSGQMNYAQLKSVVDYLYDSDRQTSLDSVSVSYNSETAALSGSLSIAKYFVSWPDAPYTPEPLPSVNLGVNDLFGTVSAPAATAPAVTAPAVG